MLVQECSAVALTLSRIGKPSQGARGPQQRSWGSIRYVHIHYSRSIFALSSTLTSSDLNAFEGFPIDDSMVFGAARIIAVENKSHTCTESY